MSISASSSPCRTPKRPARARDSASPRKRQCLGLGDGCSPKLRALLDKKLAKEKHREEWVRYDLETLLRRCAESAADREAVKELKGMDQGCDNAVYMVQAIVDSVRGAVRESVEEGGQMILEAELYLEWLKGYEFILKAVENILNAKLHRTRRRVPGLGWILFPILYHLADEFISDVNAHQDGWSHREPVGPIEPYRCVMTLAEESNDPSADDRSTEAVCQAEAILKRMDAVMAKALARYKAEGNKRKMAVSVARKEVALARACCLLSEQTGYGGSDGMSFVLFKTTREAMLVWKYEFEVEDCGGDDSDSF